MSLTLVDYIAQVRSGSVDPQSVIKEYIQKAKDHQKTYNAYVRFHDEYALAQSIDLDSLLAGAPIAIKDNILMQGYISSCGSRMMEHYVAPYDATCFAKLQAAGGVVIGKANMDEYAMGSSNETSFFGPVINPHGTQRVAGGSSGGSAAAVAADLCLAALGTDTGGSVRQPAALCGVVGLKPTYGRVSRYGVQSMASSLDQVGIITKTVTDAKLLLSAIAGYDPNDARSNTKADQKDRETPGSLVDKKRKIALPKQFLGEGLDKQIRELFLSLVAKLRAAGHQVDEVDIPILDYSVPIYYILMPAEVSTNLARFDGIRFGYQDDTMQYDDLQAYYDHIRSAAFGPEVQRRILLGTYVLSSAHYEGFYLKASQARQKLIQDMEKTFADYDLIISPTSPEAAWKLGAKSENPLTMYLADLYTIPANLAGIPAISIPMGMVEDGGEQIPAGVQLMAPTRGESLLFAAGECLESIIFSY